MQWAVGLYFNTAQIGNDNSLRLTWPELALLKGVPAPHISVHSRGLSTSPSAGRSPPCWPMIKWYVNQKSARRAAFFSTPPAVGEDCQLAAVDQKRKTSRMSFWSGSSPPAREPQWISCLGWNVHAAYSIFIWAVHKENFQSYAWHPWTKKESRTEGEARCWSIQRFLALCMLDNSLSSK